MEGAEDQADRQVGLVSRSCEFWGQGGSGSGFRGWGVQRSKLISETLERLMELLEELTTGRTYHL